MILNDQLDGWEQVKVSPVWSLQWEHQNCHLAVKKLAEGGNTMEKHAGGHTNYVQNA